MRKNLAATGEAALIVTYGNTTRKYRPLDREIVLLGKGRRCDVSLVSPEVATVHCLIARVLEGWRLRDCTGRANTRLNGQLVRDAILNDGDVLQIGAFSFEVQLPPGERPGQPPMPASVRRVQRSRRNLAQLGLGLRKRLRLAQLRCRTQEDLDRDADRLRAMQREWEKRCKQQEHADAAARGEREALNHELVAWQTEVDRLRRRIAVLEQQLTAANSQFEVLEAEMSVARTRPTPAPGRVAWK